MVMEKGPETETAKSQVKAKTSMKKNDEKT
jgi:hypothetical protein